MNTTKNAVGITVPPTESGWYPLSVDCPSHAVLRQLGDRWSMLVISALSHQPARFGELKNAVGAISDKMLTKSLKELQALGLVECQQRVYQLTDLGVSLIPPLNSLITWVTTHMDDVLARKDAFLAYDSPLGTLGISASRQGITAIEFDTHKNTELIENTPAATYALQAAQELAEYFAGQRYSFSVPLDLTVLAPDKAADTFRYRVWESLKIIDYGTTRTYQDLAQAAGSAKAVRAVGTACKNNPWPILVPCHRIVKANGEMGNYIGGLQRKAQLLELEAQH